MWGSFVLLSKCISTTSPVHNQWLGRDVNSNWSQRSIKDQWFWPTLTYNFVPNVYLRPICKMKTEPRFYYIVSGTQNQVYLIYVVYCKGSGLIYDTIGPTFDPRSDLTSLDRVFCPHNYLVPLYRGLNGLPGKAGDIITGSPGRALIILNCHPVQTRQSYFHWWSNRSQVHASNTPNIYTWLKKVDTSRTINLLKEMSVNFIKILSNTVIHKRSSILIN